MIRISCATPNFSRISPAWRIVRSSDGEAASTPARSARRRGLSSLTAAAPSARAALVRRPRCRVRMRLPVERDAVRRSVGARPAPRRSWRRCPVTASTRPPAVTTVSPAVAVPAWKTVTPSDRRGLVEPLDRHAGLVGAWVAAARQHDRHRGVLVHRSTFARRAGPSRTPRSSSARSPASRGITTSVSGSPNRQLYSRTLGPSGGEHQPRVEQARGRRCRRARSASTVSAHDRPRSGVSVASSTHGQRRVRPHPAGVRPGVAVADALEVLGERRAARSRVPSTSANAEPRALPGAPRRAPSRPASPNAPPSRHLRDRRDRRSSRSAATVTPLPAARPSALTTARPPSSSTNATARATSVNAPARAVGMPRLDHHVLREGLRALEPRRLRPRARTRRCRARGGHRPGRPRAAPRARPRRDRDAHSSTRLDESLRRRRPTTTARCARPPRSRRCPGAATTSVTRGLRAGPRPRRAPAARPPRAPSRGPARLRGVHVPVYRACPTARTGSPMAVAASR